ncbi:MAG: ferredoxin [Thermoprotei archaeon]|nr:ferredoxin [Thermoproteales archaeon]RLE87406.1 MAG: ferredoxin [Thermoprotei archaeon]RLE98451.1 MAG: ferredoxin [Thermoprotei archaeon]
MAKKFEVTIDRDACIADGACAALCPDVFELSEEDGKAQIVKKFRVGDDPGKGLVPGDLEECVKSAAEACPVQIISVKEVEE